MNKLLKRLDKIEEPIPNTPSVETILKRNHPKLYKEICELISMFYAKDPELISKIPSKSSLANLLIKPALEEVGIKRSVRVITSLISRKDPSND